MDARDLLIEKLDPNLAVENTVNEPDIVYYDVRRDPFALYGLYNPRTETDFKRMPDEVAQGVNPAVAQLYLQTSGGRVRFSTDSQYVAIYAVMPYISRMPHMALSGSAGFDLYVDDGNGNSRFRGAFMPSRHVQNGYQAIVRFESRKLRHLTLNLPTYSQVRSLLIGLQQDATVGKGARYTNELPVVFYGSSITQGGCCSRPGNIYQNVISRRLNLDYLNLGFSGGAKGEDVMIDYLASLEMSAFVCDYDHNVNDPELLRKTHLKLYQKVREKHPDIPYLMASRIDFERDIDHAVPLRDAIFDTFRYARACGDRNVHFIDGESIFRGPYLDMCTVDGTHPTDLGFALMADAIGGALERAMLIERT